MKNENIVRVGVIGVGVIGSAHAKTLFDGAVPGACLAALCDTSAKKRAVLGEKYPKIPIFDDAIKMMDAGVVDAVIVSTPHYLHPPLTIAAFERNLHVVCEKPAGVAVSAVQKMINAHEKHPELVFSVMFNQRTNPLFMRAKEIVGSGEIGDLKRVNWIITNWYRRQSYYDSGDWRATWSGEGGGVLMNQAPHNLDLLQWICGMPEKIYALLSVGKYHEIEVEDEATIIAHYQNGAEAIFTTTTGDYPGTNRLEITGTKGRIVLENGELTLTSLQHDEREYCFNNALADNPKTVSRFRETAEDGHVLILKNFVNAVLFGEELVSPGEEAINEITLCNAAYLSSWTGLTIGLPFDQNDTELFDQELALRVQESILEKSQRNTAASDAASASSDSYLPKWQTNW